MTAGRRLAAIVAADIVGYSRLMGENEAGTARAVREHRDAARPIVADHGGRIVKTTGDGLLLEFPSVVAAVECAIAIQKLMVESNAGRPEAKRIVYRIGVNLGDVLIEGDDILGDGVNIAARLEGLCEPGGVLISGTAYDHVRGKIDAHFVDLGDKDLKNVVRPVRVYALNTGSEISPIALSAFEPGGRGPPRLSIVVLPFANIGGDPDQDYFVDGVTESLTTDLSRIPNAVVIARNTAFTYKGRPLDAKTIGRELNVRYVLEGSVQRSGDPAVCGSMFEARHRRRNRQSSVRPSGSTSPSLTSSTCRTKSSRAWQASSGPSSPAPRRDARNRPRTPTRWTSAFRVRFGFIRVRLLTIWPKRGTISIARSLPIRTMSKRSLDRRRRTRSLQRPSWRIPLWPLLRPKRN